MIEKNENKISLYSSRPTNICHGKNSLPRLSRNDFLRYSGRKILIPIESFTKWLLENAVN